MMRRRDGLRFSSRSAIGQWILLVHVALALACGDSATSSDRTDNPPADSEGVLALDLQIGQEAPSDSRYQFAEVLSVVVALDGTIWTLDGNSTPGFNVSPRVRMFSASGQFIRDVGRNGDGPGEYRNPYVLALLKDGRVALRDFANRSYLTVFRSSGDLDELWYVGENRTWPFRGAVGLKVDTAGIVWMPFRDRPGRDRPAPAFMRLTPDGTIIDSIPYPEIPSIDGQYFEVPDPSPGSTSTQRFRVPYRPTGTWAWSSLGTFALARTNQYRVEVLSPPGAALTSATYIEREILPVAVGAAERAELQLALEKEVQTVIGRPVQVPEIPQTKPPISYIEYAEDGRLLVFAAAESHLENGVWVQPSALDVFETDGRFRVRVHLPHQFRLHGVRGDKLWGTWLDHETDVETIRLYSIR